MKYNSYSQDDFVKDEYFQKWVLNPDTMTANFWENWLSDYPEKKTVVENAKRLILLLNADNHKLSEADFDTMWRNIIEKRTDPVSETNSKKSLRINKNIIFYMAAVFVGLIALGVGINSLNFTRTFGMGIDSEPEITLELEDGTIAVLYENASKIIKNKKGKVVFTQEKNKAQYEQGNSVTENLVYNTLNVPYGKKFQIVLSDGSHVFLNSGSNLRYPVKFIKGKPRNVYLDGEAYFSVEKDKNAFTVITDEMNTQVYGTEFNVSSYKNENNTSTVLVEGSVGVYRANNEEALNPIIITPGERAVFEENTISVNKTDISKYIAWKDNKLLFVNDRFDLVLKELERHFNIEIENHYPQLSNKRFTGTFEDQTLGNILNTFNAHTPFDFNVANEGKIIITNKNSVN